jgi:peptide chain release factor 1
MKPSMKAKLEQLDARLAELNSLLVQEEITKDMDQYRKLNREHAEISPVVEQFQLFLQAEADEQAALAMQADPEMKDFAEEEIKSAKARMETMQADLQRLLLPKDPNDDKISFWKFVRAPAVMKALYSPLTYSGCTHALLKDNVGK